MILPVCPCSLGPRWPGREWRCMGCSPEAPESKRIGSFLFRLVLDSGSLETPCPRMSTPSTVTRQCAANGKRSRHWYLQELHSTRTHNALLGFWVLGSEVDGKLMRLHSTVRLPLFENDRKRISKKSTKSDKNNIHVVSF